MGNVVNTSIIPMTQVPSWFQNADALEAYLWCEMSGNVVWGSKTTPYGGTDQPVRTGDTIIDIFNWLIAVFAAETGEAAVGIPYIEPWGTFLNGYGIVGVPYPNGFGISPPQIAIAADDAYAFGDMNIPASSGEPGSERQWYVKFTAIGEAATSNASWPLVENWIATDGEGIAPAFHVLELKSIE